MTKLLMPYGSARYLGVMAKEGVSKGGLMTKFGVPKLDVMAKQGVIKSPAPGAGRVVRLNAR